MDKNLELLNLLPVIHEGIVDQTLPTNSGSGLFKIDTHDNQKIFLDSFIEVNQELSYFHIRVSHGN